MTPDVRLDRLERVQVLSRSTYWVKQGQSEPPPVITDGPFLTVLDYSLADIAGGDAITVTGTGLSGATTCTVGGTSATITANTPTSVTFTMPAKSAGTYNVQVTTAVGASNTLAIEAWNPVVESPQALYQCPNYNGTTNTFTATVGSNAVGIGGPPYPAAVGGCPDFERATDYTLGNNAFTLASWGGTGERTLFAVFDAESITTTQPNSNVWMNETLIADAGRFMGLLLRKNGSNFETMMFDYDGAARLAIVDITSLLNASGAGRIIVQGKKQGGTLYARAIGNSGTGAWVTGDACGATTNQTYGIRLGGNEANSPDGILRAIGSKTAAWSDAAAAKFEKWARSRYR